MFTFSRMTLLTLFLLAACAPAIVSTVAPTGAPIPTPVIEPTSEVTSPAMNETTYPEAVLAAINTLSKNHSIPADQISVVKFAPVEWNNSCLGLARADEMCLQAITPGYLVILSAGGEEFEFHTNESGSAIRQK